jgi:hypothetical protein
VDRKRYTTEVQERNVDVGDEIETEESPKKASFDDKVVSTTSKEVV